MLENALRAVELELPVPSLTAHGPAESPAYLSNGVVGLSVPFDTPLHGKCAVGSVAYPDPETGTEAVAPVPYPLGLDLRYGGYWLWQVPPARATSQTYDFATGELTTLATVQVGRQTVELEIVTFCCRSLPNLVVQTVTPRPWPDDWRHRIGLAHEDECEHGISLSMEGGGKLGIACNSRSEGGSITQIAALVPARMHSEPAHQAARLAYLGRSRGVERLRADNRAAWQRIWSKRPVAPFAGAQSVVDAAFFYLNASIHPAAPNSTGLFGLAPRTNYHNFLGHLFWDLETHCLPPLLVSQPEAAKAMLEARFRGLEAARWNASMNGYRGAQFPWEASTRGEEALPLGALRMLYEQHITLDVALAFAQASRTLEDPVFSRERAWPVLKEVAEWIVSRVDEDAEGYHIRQVIGIDEGVGPIDDAVWLNALARRVLREANRHRVEATYPFHEGWADIADRLVLPNDGATLIPHAGWDPHTGSDCPDPAMVVFPLGEPLDPNLAAATLRRFLAKSESSLGMPMHSPYHWYWAHLVGDPDLARARWGAGVEAFMFGPFQLIDEYASGYTEGLKPRIGPYLAHCGAIVQTCYAHATRQGRSTGILAPETNARRQA